MTHAPFVFDPEALQTRAAAARAGYADAAPFPCAVLDDFLPEEAANDILELFPGPDAPCWFNPADRDPRFQKNKLGLGDASRMHHLPPRLQHYLMVFNSSPFLRFLETLTGIGRLLPDPHYYGGGLHQNLPGAHLKVHADFNYLPPLDLYRKLNVLLYLNKDWHEEWNGHLELWDATMENCVQRVAPIFNRCVVFTTSGSSYHGHPDPLMCPEGVTRKSLAFYYYGTQPRPDDPQHHSTLWRARPGGER